MLIAQQRVTGRLTDAKDAGHEDPFICPACHQCVVLRSGRIRQPYFAHQRRQACHSFSEGETDQHLLGKRQLTQWFLAQGGVVQLERPLQALHQRPDLLLNGRVAIEFQCSPIKHRRLRERISGYQQGGYQQLWLLGQPYAPRKRLNLGKVGQFLLWHPTHGACVLYWSTTKNAMVVLSGIKVAPFLPVLFQEKQFQTLSSWHEWWQKREGACGETQLSVANRRRQQRAISWGLHYRQPTVMAWQALCYAQHQTLQTLPEWVFGDEYETPYWLNSVLAWRIPLVLWWQLHPTSSTRQRVTAWQQYAVPSFRWFQNVHLVSRQMRQTISEQQCATFFCAEHEQSLLK